jgi:aminopeptidase N
MKRIVILLPALALVSLAPLKLQAIEESSSLKCYLSAGFLAPSDAPVVSRKYAPDREVQMLHLAIDVTPNFSNRTIEATTTLRFKATSKPVLELKFDAFLLRVRTVTSTVKLQAYQSADEQLIVTFAEPIAPGQEAGVTVTYSAEPTEGIYFRTPEMGYKPGDTHLFTQGEEIEARHWFPCLDSPNQRFTSEVTCRVPDGMTVISNGRLVSQDKDAATGLTAFHWSQEKPHSSYLITLCAGTFKKLEDKLGDLPLTFYTPASEFAQAANSFRDTKDIMEYFQQDIGVPYPWAQYAQVCVNDFVAGGMENTSATTLTDSTLFTDATENIHSSEDLVAHELAHQWFGDLVTCKDWANVWLNESFATYYETLYRGHKHGRDHLLYELYDRIHQITGIPNDVNPIVRRNYDKPREMFGYLTYPKGSLVLHMLRSQLGDDMYRRCIKTYLERHQLQNVVTEDLRAVIEELTGRSYDQFFDQWVYHAHHPELDVNYNWDEQSALARISVRQNQTVSDAVLLFNFPFTVRFKGKFGVTNVTMQVTKKEEDFYFPLPSGPEVVRLDPDCALLAKISFSPSRAMLNAQLADSSDMLGRLYAIEQLSSRRDHEAVAQLKKALNEDVFYGVRIEAARALRNIHSDEARDALLASREQPDARVRAQVIGTLGAFYSEKICDTQLGTTKSEKNPEIVATAIRDLSYCSKPEVHDTLVRYLNSNSYRNELADAAIGAMRGQDDPVFIDPLLDALTRREAEFTTGGFARAIETLAYLARNEEKKDKVREFLIRQVNHKKRGVHLASIRSLGTLGDPKAIAVLTTFTLATGESLERGSAERAIADLRAGRKPIDDYKNLRQDVLELQKANRELRKEMDDLKKITEATPAPAAGAPPGKNAPAKKPKDPKPKS